MGKLELNSTMLELQKSEGAGFKTFALCYLLYIAVMVIFQIIFKNEKTQMQKVMKYLIFFFICVII